jgi:hypothetical protein
MVGMRSGVNGALVTVGNTTVVFNQIVFYSCASVPTIYVYEG